MHSVCSQIYAHILHNIQKLVGQSNKKFVTAANAACRGNLSLAILGTCAVRLIPLA